MKKVTFGIIFLLLIVLLSACTSVNKKSTTTGNSNSNLVNGGIACIQDDTIYYCTENGLFSCNKEGNDTKEIFSTPDENDCIYNINVVGDWIYYENFIGGERKLYRVKKNGKNNQEISSVGNHSHLVEDSIYLRNRSDIYVIDKTGKNEKKLFTEDTSSDYTVNFENEWIYFCAKDDDGYAIYRRSLDGKQREKLYDGRTDYMIVYNDYIYFQGYRDYLLYRMKLDGAEIENVFGDELLWSFNITDGWIYYCNRNDYGMYKVKLDGTDAKKICSGKVSEINVVGDWIYYFDHDRKKGEKIQCRIKTDGTEFQELGDRNETYYGEKNNISKEVPSTDETLTNLLNGDFSEFAGSYVATKESNDAMGGGQKLNNLILKNDGSISGGGSHYSKEFYPSSKPTSISKNEDGSYVCEFTENSYYTIYPKGIIEDRKYVKENQSYLKDTVYINCIVVDGGVLNVTYYLETISNTTEKTVKYDGVDWVSLDNFTQEIGGVFESGTGIKYTVTDTEENESGRLTVFFTSQDGKKRKVSNIPAFLIDNGIMYYNIYEQ